MPSVKGKRVQIVGDSLSASTSSPGGQLAARLTAAGADVHVNAKVGRSARSFLRESDHADQVKKIDDWQPDLAIVMLGTNDIGYAAGVNRTAMGQVLIELRASGAQVWAVGPPAFAPGVRDGGAGVVDVMREVFGSGRFLDLRPLTSDLTAAPARAGDQIHFTAQGGALVGQRLADRFQQAGGGGATLAVALGTVLLLGWVLSR